MNRLSNGFGRLRELLSEAGKDVLGEKRCLACSCVYVPETDGTDAIVCPDCVRLLPARERGFCPRCGEIFAWSGLPCSLCRFCLEAPPPFQRVFFHGVHEGLLRRLLLDMKFRGQVGLAYALGRLLCEHPGMTGLSVDCIVPVPLHTARLRQRGFNQSLELAKPVAKRLGTPLEAALLERIRKTTPQTGLTRERRRSNTRGAFTIKGTIEGAHVLLLDDVMTTGATLASAADALLRAGASQVSVAVISRAPSAFLVHR